VSLVRWFNEWSSDLNKVLEISVLVSGTSRVSGLSLVFSDHVSQDLGPSIVGDGFAWSQMGLLLGDAFIEEGLELIFKRSLAGLSKLGVFVELLELLVVSLIREQLERMDVVGHKLKLSVALVSESSGTTVLDLLRWGLRGKRNREEFSEGDDESFLKN